MKNKKEKKREKKRKETQMVSQGRGSAHCSTAGCPQPSVAQPRSDFPETAGPRRDTARCWVTVGAIC